MTRSTVPDETETRLISSSSVDIRSAGWCRIAAGKLIFACLVEYSRQLSSLKSILFCDARHRSTTRDLSPSLCQLMPAQGSLSAQLMYNLLTAIREAAIVITPCSIITIDLSLKFGAVS